MTDVGFWATAFGDLLRSATRALHARPLRVGLLAAIPPRAEWGGTFDLDQAVLRFVSNLSALVIKYGSVLVTNEDPTFQPIVVEQARHLKPEGHEAALKIVRTADLNLPSSTLALDAEDAMTAAALALVGEVDALVTVGWQVRGGSGYAPHAPEQLALAAHDGVPCFLVGALPPEGADADRQLLLELTARNHLDEKTNIDIASVSGDLDEVAGRLLVHFATHGDRFAASSRYRALSRRAWSPALGRSSDRSELMVRGVLHWCAQCRAAFERRDVAAVQRLLRESRVAERSIHRIRNIGLLGLPGAGRTLTTERLLSAEDTTARSGDAQARAAAATCSWRDHDVTIITTPRHPALESDVERSLRALDGAVAVFDAVAGVGVHSTALWRRANDRRVPRIAFVNRMDGNGADFMRTIEQIQQELRATVVPIQVPIGEGDRFRGVIDLVRMRAITYDRDAPTGDHRITEVPHELLDDALHHRERVVESAAELDEFMLEKYLEGSVITDDEIVKVLRQRTIQSAREDSTPFVVATCGSALRNSGMQPLLDAIVDYLPSPADLPAIEGVDPDSAGRAARRPSDDDPFSAWVFKVATDRRLRDVAFLRVYSGVLSAGARVYNSTRREHVAVQRLFRAGPAGDDDIQTVHAGDVVAAIGLQEVHTGDTLCDPGHPIVFESIRLGVPLMSVTLEPPAPIERQQLQVALARLTVEDPTIHVQGDAMTGQVTVSGTSEAHLEAVIDRLTRDFGIQMSAGSPRVAYKERLTRSADGEGKYDRQTGGHRQYAHVKIHVYPGEPGSGYVFKNEAAETAIPASFISSIASGIGDARLHGVVTGYPIDDLMVVLYDGSFEELASSEKAFRLAGAMAMQDAARRAEPALVEPIMEVEVVTPMEYAGDIMGALASRRGRIDSLDTRGDAGIVHARVPLSEMFGFEGELRSRTQDRGTFSMQFSSYERVPHLVRDDVPVGDS